MRASRRWRRCEAPNHASHEGICAALDKSGFAFVRNRSTMASIPAFVGTALTVASWCAAKPPRVSLPCPLASFMTHHHGLVAYICLTLPRGPTLKPSEYESDGA